MRTRPAPMSSLAPLGFQSPTSPESLPNTHPRQAPQAPDAPGPWAHPTHPVAGAEVLALSVGSWEMAETWPSWSFFHFPFRIWPGWMTGQDGREGLALPPLLKGQGDPVV